MDINNIPALFSVCHSCPVLGHIASSAVSDSSHVQFVAVPLPQTVSQQDENGVNRPVCSYVRVLRAGRLLESPRQAARFVSLLAHEKAPVVGGGGGKQEQWCTLMAFLCRGKVTTLWRGRTHFNVLQDPSCKKQTKSD